jgi:Tfp pilus assembly protein PilF
MPATAAPARAASADSYDMHHEANEALRRGEVERALVLASKVVKLWPESIAGRALYERARRELSRGLRRERLDARVQEARHKLDAGDFAGAEKIVVSALKLIPDHPEALALFAGLKARRLGAPGAEAEAERELQRLGAKQAQRAVLAAHTAIANGWERRALLAVRRGLRLVPDDPELLALLRELQGGPDEGQDPQRSHRRALQSQVRAAMELLREKKLEESLRLLREVLRADPDNVRAQEAVQQVRRAWLRRTAPPVPRAAPESVARRPAAPAPVRGPAAPPPAAPAMHTPAPLASSRPPLRTSAAETLEEDLAFARRPPAPPPAAPGALRVPRAALWLVPLGLLAVAALAFVLRGRAPARTAVGDAAVSSEVSAAATPEPVASAPAAGPLSALPADLRGAVEAALAAYGSALERQDEASLAQARPDLSARERAALLEPFRGALNVGVDLRVVDAAADAEQAVVTVLRTDVIVDGHGGARPPVEEVLRFVRRAGAWTIGGGR